MLSGIRNILAAATGLLLLTVTAAPASHAQAKKPTIMVVPDDAWCTANGYIIETDNQGKTTRTPDYERALQELSLIHI